MYIFFEEIELVEDLECVGDKEELFASEASLVYTMMLSAGTYLREKKWS